MSLSPTWESPPPVELLPHRNPRTPRTSYPASQLSGQLAFWPAGYPADRPVIRTGTRPELDGTGTGPEPDRNRYRNRTGTPPSVDIQYRCRDRDRCVVCVGVGLARRRRPSRALQHNSACCGCVGDVCRLRRPRCSRWRVEHSRSPVRARSTCVLPCSRHSKSSSMPR